MLTELGVYWFNRSDSAGIDSAAMIAGQICAWFADCWKTVDGPGFKRTLHQMRGMLG
jgi:hypothetical protein